MPNQLDFIQAPEITFVSLSLILVARYFGLVFLMGWALNKFSFLKPRHIYDSSLSKPLRKFEIIQSLKSTIVFSASGTLVFEMWKKGSSTIYLQSNEFGYFYLFLSLIVYALAHETYFYWTHRLFHIPKFFKFFHKAHHKSRWPTAWTSFSFDLSESFIQALFLPLMVWFVPIHWSVLLFFLMVMSVLGIINHLGIEIYPQNMPTHKIGKWIITPTHHYIHHRDYNSNFGLYFTFWDYLMGTESADYEKLYSELKLKNADWTKDRAEAGFPAPEESL